jgi:pimeloyl-ACP methyl ester carboxylesterase
MQINKTFLLLIFITAALLHTNFAQADLNDTHWEGAVVRNNSIQAVEFDWKVQGDSLTGLFSIPELGLYNQNVREINYNYPKLYFRFIYGKFEMSVHADNLEMTGGNPKWNPPVYMHLKLQVEYNKLYKIEEVKFNNKDVTLAGSLFLPSGEQPYAAVIIIHGSSGGSRSKWSYNFWGYFFARQGIAALIYDKRGIGKSTGDLESASFDDLAYDAASGFKYLTLRSDIDKDKIGLFGSSQGGWLAPLAASRIDGVSYLILNVAPSVSVAKQELDRVVYTLRAKKYSEQDIKLAKEYTEKMFEVSYDYRNLDELKPLLDSVKNKEWADVLTLVESKSDLEDWRRIKYDPASVLRETTIPVFVSYAENDHYVPPQENEALMKQYLEEAGNKDYTIVVIPDIGHNMFTGQTLKGGEWSWPDSYWQWDKKSPELLISIRRWLLKHSFAK